MSSLKHNIGKSSIASSLVIVGNSRIVISPNVPPSPLPTTQSSSSATIANTVAPKPTKTPQPPKSSSAATTTTTTSQLKQHQPTMQPPSRLYQIARDLIKLHENNKSEQRGGKKTTTIRCSSSSRSSGPTDSHHQNVASEIMCGSTAAVYLSEKEKVKEFYLLTLCFFKVFHSFHSDSGVLILAITDCWGIIKCQPK